MDPSRIAKRTIAGLLCVALASCGGGGSSGAGSGPAGPGPAPPAAAPPAAPIGALGLDMRASLADFDLPERSDAVGTFSLRNAFPDLPAFAAPLFLAAVPGDDQLVVLEQSGRIRAFDAASDASDTRLVLDLSARILFAGEQGLLGLAFDPDFAVNRRLYLHYSMDAPRRSVISRFRWDVASEVIDPASEVVLLEQPQPFSNHNGGMLAFGPGDFLYIAFGDGGSGGDPQNNGQDASNLLGTLLRIDVHPSDPQAPYAIPADNPFIGIEGFRDEILALGLRNPFRFSFDRQSGDLWIGDVGQNAREEINLIAAEELPGQGSGQSAGFNFGWRRFEGTLAFDPGTALAPGTAHRLPVLDYGRALGVSVIGGYVYRGNRLPALFGRYLYSDFGSGTIWALDADNGALVSNEALATAPSPTSFGEGPGGELYVVSRTGTLLELVDEGDAGGDGLPTLLSATGLFTDLATLTPAAGLVEYDLIVPFWSDGTRKRRWFAVPDAAQIGFRATGAWDLPRGSIVVKHFEIEFVEGDAASARRLETRVLLHGSDGWQGFTWRWNEAGTDAELLAARESVLLEIEAADGSPRSQRYDFPSRTDCLRCHTQAAGSTLGLATRQLNRAFAYPLAVDNQLRTLDGIDYFAPPAGDATAHDAYPQLTDTSATIVRRARAYLDVNCAQCHRPGGPTPVTLDLRFDTADAGMGAIGVVPVSGALGVEAARIIDPGSRATSTLWLRMQRLDGTRMPPLSSHRVDEEGVALIGAWIDGL